MWVSALFSDASRVEHGVAIHVLGCQVGPLSWPCSVTVTAEVPELDKSSQTILYISMDVVYFWSSTRATSL